MSLSHFVCEDINLSVGTTSQSPAMRQSPRLWLKLGRSPLNLDGSYNTLN